MNEIVNVLFVIILSLNLFALSNGRILSVIRIVAAQGVLLGLLPVLMEDTIQLETVIASVSAIALKGFIIPAIMVKALRDVHIKREIEPLIGLMQSTVIGALVTATVFLFSGMLTGTGTDTFIIPTSITTVITGLIILITRYKALTQVLGYLVLENGIFIFSLLLVDSIPLVVEMGMLLDLVVSIFIVSIIANHITHAFSSHDTRKLATLKE